MNGPNLFFILSIVFATRSVRRLFSGGSAPAVDLRELGLHALIAYCLILVAIVPLLFFDSWGVVQHGLVLVSIGLAGCLIGKNRGKFFYLPSLGDHPSLLIIFSFVGAMAIGLQFHPIYYLYSTHDSGIYLNVARHLFTTGHFEHVDPLAAAANSPADSILKPLFPLKDGIEPWKRITAYGYNVENERTGVFSFHGLFGTPVFLALGMKFFGIANALRMHWIHFLVCLALFMQILNSTIPNRKRWVLVGGTLFAISPLLTLLFREPLSEPLNLVFFLGFCFAITQFQMEKERISGLWLLTLCLCASILTRMNGLLYLPFFCITLFMANKKTRTLWVGSTMLVLTTLTAAFYSRTFYVISVLEGHIDFFHTALSNPKYQKIISGIAIGLALLGVGLVIAQRLRHARLIPKIGARAIGRALVTIFLICNVIIYYRVFTHLSNQYVRFPFVIYPIDTLLFYVGPVLFVVGLIGLYRWLVNPRNPSLLFLQLYTPFCFFFFCVAEFNANTIQIYFLRYYVELVALLIFGGTFWLSELTGRHSALFWRRLAASFSIAWCAVLVWSLDRPDYCETTLQTYTQLDQKLSELSKNKPVLVMAGLSWSETAFLMPLSVGFDREVALAGHGLDYHEEQAVKALAEQGYTPILALGGNHPEEFEQAGLKWKRTENINHCYQYSKFNLGAPPFELEKTCIALNWYQADGAAPSRTIVDKPIQSALRYEGDATNQGATEWYGVKAHGPTLCAKTKSAPVHFKLRFGPQLTFSAPTLEINGISHSEMMAISPASTATNHRFFLVDVAVPVDELDCSKWNSIDLVFQTTSNGEKIDRATVLEGPAFTSPSHQPT